MVDFTVLTLLLITKSKNNVSHLETGSTTPPKIKAPVSSMIRGGPRRFLNHG